MNVELKTGHYVSVEGLYAKTAPKQHVGSRHLLSLHWGLLKGASPGYYGLICLFSVLCPSFEVAGQILGIHGVAYNRDRGQELANHFAHQCKPRQASLTRAPGESLEGKRVITDIDAGRTPRLGVGAGIRRRNKRPGQCHVRHPVEGAQNVRHRHPGRRGQY
jgi:hypothetical protein